MSQTAQTPRIVCFYSVATHLGGGERSLLELVCGLQKNPDLGFIPWVILPSSKGPLAEELSRAGIRFDVLPMPSAFMKISRSHPLQALLASTVSAPSMTVYLAKLRSLIQKGDAVLLHTNGLKCHALSAAISPGLGIPLIWHLRDILPVGATNNGLRLLHSLSQAHVIANSNASQASFKVASTSSRAPKVTVVHNGLDPERYFPARNRAFHAELQLRDDIPLIGILGVLARWKGQVEFIRMAKALVDQGSNAHFAVIGDEIYDTTSDTGYRDRLKAEVSRFGLHERIHFMGFRSDAVQALNGLDILVHASIRPEPFGRVILEGMACGVPVVASAAGGVLEFVEDGKDGLLFSPGEEAVNAMAARVASLLSDAAARNRIALGAREKFLSAFTLQAHVEKVVSVYRRVLNS